MYNRYIPQQDGSHKRNRVEDPPSPAQNQHRPSPPPVLHANAAPPPPVHQPPLTGNISGFLRRLIPKDFDTGDLIVVLLLLLMAGDKPEEKSSSLLTLALYCFL